VANSLSLKISSYRYLCSIVNWHEILMKINVVSQILQNPNTDIKKSATAFDDLIEFFKNCRNDNGFEKILKSASKLAQNLHVEPKFAEVTS